MVLFDFAKLIACSIAKVHLKIVVDFDNQYVKSVSRVITAASNRMFVLDESVYISCIPRNGGGFHKGGIIMFAKISVF